MSLRNLKWLTLLGAFGLLGLFLRQPTFYAMFGLFVFTPLFWADERSDANLGRAGVIAYTATLFALIITFFRTGVGIWQGWEPSAFVKLLAMSLAATFEVSVLVFIASYLYYEYRGV